MTGLSAADKLIEIAVIITDDNLNIVAEVNWGQKQLPLLLVGCPLIAISHIFNIEIGSQPDYPSV
jgi:hypothetical protein